MILTFGLELQTQMMREGEFFSLMIDRHSRCYNSKLLFRFVYNSSGLAIKFSSWALSPTNEPDNSGDCVAIKGQTGDWFDESSSTTKQSVCEDLQDGLSFWSACPDGWDLINKKCYKYIDQTLKFDTALNMCRAIREKIVSGFIRFF